MRPRPGILASNAKRTRSNDTDWRQHNANGIYLNVDTSACGLGSTPSYFTSLGGTSYQWTTKGATSIYRPTPTGFRVYVYQSGITAAFAKSKRWHINWRAETPEAAYTTACTGTTAAGGTGWFVYGTNGIGLNLDTSVCGFDARSVPLVFTTLGGSSSHWATTGATSIYNIADDGFSVYINKSNLTPDYANARNWHIRWSALP